MDYALIKSGLVENVIVADDDFVSLISGQWDRIESLETAQEQALGVGIGWGWDGTQFVAPVAPEAQPPVPQECTPAQGLVALFALKGITEQNVQTAIDDIADPAARYTAQIAFARAATWRRGNGTMQQLAALLGLSDADMSALFAFAVTVEA